MHIARSLTTTTIHRAQRATPSASTPVPRHFSLSPTAAYTYRTAALMPPKRRRDDVVEFDYFTAVAYATTNRAGQSSSAYVPPAVNGYHVDAVPPTPKRARKKKDPNSPVEEKRLARVRNSCPQNIQERVGRVMTQRFFLIDRERDGDELRETFKVLGSTGNIYTVIVDKKPECDCPDAMKGNHCKHILFVFLKVLGVSQASKLYYQKALLSTELAEIFNSAPAAPTVIAAERIRAAYTSATTGGPVPVAEDKKRLPEEGDDCPVCYESMPAGKEDGLVFCKVCGNGLHKECFQQWAKTPNGRTCVSCRAPWPHASASAATPDKATTNGGRYLNISGVAGISPVRDTSTYYHGPRRGVPSWQEPNYYDD